MSPASPTRATLSAPASTTTRVGITRAISVLKAATGVRASTNRIISAASPLSKDARLMLPGWLMTLTALASGYAPCAGAGQVRDLSAHDVDRDAGQEADHRRVRDEPRVPAQSRDAGGGQRDADHDHQQRDTAGRSSGAALQRRAGRQRGGGRGRDHDQAGIGTQAGDRSCEARVQALHRVKAGQDRGRHAVGHAADRARQAGRYLPAQVRPLRPDGA